MGDDRAVAERAHDVLGALARPGEHVLPDGGAEAPRRLGGQQLALGHVGGDHGDRDLRAAGPNVRRSATVPSRRRTATVCSSTGSGAALS